LDSLDIACRHIHIIGLFKHIPADHERWKFDGSNFETYTFPVRGIHPDLLYAKYLNEILSTYYSDTFGSDNSLFDNSIFFTERRRRSKALDVQPQFSTVGRGESPHDRIFGNSRQ
jgi:hypothetical protein